MPRTARIYLEEGVFHVLARGNNKQKVVMPPFSQGQFKLEQSSLTTA